MIRTCFALTFALLAGVLRAQDFENLEMRVISVGAAGTVVVDRGERDLLAAGDTVFFYPRGGGSYRGTVRSADDRTATVEMQDRSFTPRVGTRARARIPADRGAEREPKPRTEPKPEPVEPKPQQQPERDDRWQNRDEEWKPGMPLLSQMKPVRPEDRGMRVTGRVYSFGELRWDDSQDYDNSTLRIGTDLEVENPFGRGGGIHVDYEVDYRTEQNEKSGLDLLPRRASYYVGGTRFDPVRMEFGRFLQHGMPEFGVLDGMEFGTRLGNGHRYGASIGFMPEPDDDFESLQDLQLAGYYRYIPENNERFELAAGYQKSFHDGKADRDLFVFKSHYLPLEPGWRFYTSTWIDLYGGRDDEKNKGVEITQAIVTTGREFADGDTLDLTYRRIRFPELLRNEFPPLIAGELADNRYDRLQLSYRNPVSEWTTWIVELSGYDDEDDSGGAGEFGADLHSWFSEGGTTTPTVFGSDAQHTNSIGARLQHHQPTDDGYWSALYEFGHHRVRGFDDNLDDIIQHRARFERSMYTSGGWSISIYGDAHLFDEELAFGVGFYVQRAFRSQEVY